MSNDAIKVFEKGSDERNTLKQFASDLNAAGTKTRYEVREVFFDAGQDWKWTTLIGIDTTQPAGSVTGSWQALNPKEQERVLYGTDKDRAIVMDSVRGKAVAKS